MGNLHFGAPKQLVLDLRDMFGIRTFIETGTNKAETSVWASGEFEKVVTIEGYEPLYRRAVETFGDRKNIRFLLGDSRKHIIDICSSLTEPAVFWLDAHWCGEHTFGDADECPLLGELEALNSSPIPHVVMIDDARLFLSPPPKPHKADHWPDLGTLCRVLSLHRSDRYVAVHQDVILAVPGTAKPRITEYLQSQAKVETSCPQPKLPPLWRRGLSRILGS